MRRLSFLVAPENIMAQAQRFENRLVACEASSNARTLPRRPATNGIVMPGKTTDSRMGIIGRLLVWDSSMRRLSFLALF